MASKITTHKIPTSKAKIKGTIVEKIKNGQFKENQNKQVRTASSNVEKLFRESGFSLKEFAVLTGIKRQNINKLFKSPAGSINYKHLQMFCDVLDVDPNTLLQLEPAQRFVIIDVKAGSVLIDEATKVFSSDLTRAVYFEDKKSADKALKKIKRKNKTLVIPDDMLQKVRGLQRKK